VTVVDRWTDRERQLEWVLMKAKVGLPAEEQAILEAPEG
jgi:hypothetical protein